jgi:hypothetical protein
MAKRFIRCLVLPLVLCLTAANAAALDVQIGRIDAAYSAFDASDPRHGAGVAVGAMLTIPFGAAGPGPASATVNGRDIAGFTRQNAKDATISLMLIGTAIALGVLSVTALAGSISSD